MPFAGSPGRSSPRWQWAAGPTSGLRHLALPWGWTRPTSRRATGDEYPGRVGAGDWPILEADVAGRPRGILACPAATWSRVAAGSTTRRRGVPIRRPTGTVLNAARRRRPAGDALRRAGVAAGPCAPLRHACRSSRWASRCRSRRHPPLRLVERPAPAASSRTGDASGGIRAVRGGADTDAHLLPFLDYLVSILPSSILARSGHPAADLAVLPACWRRASGGVGVGGRAGPAGRC